jgi:hypothetical protein
VWGEKKRPGWLFWCVGGLTLPLLFVLSIGPSCWVRSRFGGAKAVTIVYRPATVLVEMAGSDGLDKSVKWYSGLFAANGWCWMRVFPAACGIRGDAEWIWGEWPASFPR